MGFFLFRLNMKTKCCQFKANQTISEAKFTWEILVEFTRRFWNIPYTPLTKLWKIHKLN